jgi:thiol:disulfide interchange protein DsbC
MRSANLLIALFALLPIGHAGAADPSETALLLKLQKLYPASEISKVERTPVSDLYEVTFGPNIAFVGADGRHFVFGHLFDMQKQVDLTAQKLATREPAPESAAKITFHDLPLSDAIKTVKGDGSRSVAIFTDPRCQYCSRLDEELAPIDNLTVYRFLIPILGPDSRTAALTAWRQAKPDRADDTAVLDRNLRLAEKLHITGTPTLVSGDDRVHSGVMFGKQLDAWLAIPERTATRTESINQR